MAPHSAASPTRIYTLSLHDALPISAINKKLRGRNMSVSEEPANLADMVRARAKSRGDAIAYEFEGRQTSFADFDIKTDRKSTRLNSSHSQTSYAVFCLKKKTKTTLT